MFGFLVLAATTAGVSFSGGHHTNPVDNGRPVRLVAAGLGVPTKVFRKAFSGVTPAAGGAEPDPAQVQRNKAALLEVLAPYGVTNEDLDRVSDFYRYSESAGEHWQQTGASATAIVRNGKVVSIKLGSGGAGYTSAPAVTVPGYAVSPKVKLRFGKDLATNGSVKSIKLR